MTGITRSAFCLAVWLCIVVWASGGDFVALAQTRPVLQDYQQGLREWGKAIGEKVATVPPTAGVFFEGAVNPDEYVLGPGDRLSIVFWQPTFVEIPCQVNGEGDVIVPQAGVVAVAGLTLREGRARIQAEVARAFRVGSVSVSLVQPRRFRVHVTGLVEAPGTYDLSATSRVADAIMEAGGLKRERDFARADTSWRVIASQRRIEVRDLHGTLAGYADLLLFERGGLPAANPHLRDGQTIHVPYPAEGALHIGVFGAVHRSGLYEYAEHDSLYNALILAGGLASDADSTSVTVVPQEGEPVRLNLRTHISEALAYRLKPGDRVHVLGRGDSLRRGSVDVNGEVVRPGGYAIQPGKTTVWDVVSLAGGLRSTAAANSARLVRKPARDPVEAERLRLLTAAVMPRFVAGEPPMKNDPAIAAEFLRWEYGTVVLDLTDSAAAAQVTLQDGDVLEIPRTPLGVRVLGGVNQAGEVAWESGKKLEYYLRKAGGVNYGGWKRRTVLIKARNGSQLRYSATLSIDPGDVIYVPFRPELTTWDVVKDLAAVAAQTATIALVIQNFRK